MYEQVNVGHQTKGTIIEEPNYKANKNINMACKTASHHHEFNQPIATNATERQIKGVNLGIFVFAIDSKWGWSFILKLQR